MGSPSAVHADGSGSLDSSEDCSSETSSSANAFESKDRVQVTYLYIQMEYCPRY